jgi:hypothetical protein
LDFYCAVGGRSGGCAEFYDGLVKRRFIDVLVGSGQKIVDAAEMMGGFPIEFSQDSCRAERPR